MKSVEEAQSVLRRNKERKAKENIAYINRKTREKNFEENQIVSYSKLKIEAGISMCRQKMVVQIAMEIRKKVKR